MAQLQSSAERDKLIKEGKKRTKRGRDGTGVPKYGKTHPSNAQAVKEAVTIMHYSSSIQELPLSTLSIGH